MSNKDIKALLNDSAAIVESEMKKYIANNDAGLSVIFEAMEYSLMAGGKRIRPFLVFEFARLANKEQSGEKTDKIPDSAVAYASAIEMIHTYSLIHDDLPCMDNDNLRRGKPTCHIKFGEANALLAGDGLLTMAFFAASGNKFASAETNCKAVTLLSSAAGAFGMIGGQILDLAGEKERFDIKTLEKLQALKTGELIRAASLLGCYAGGASDKLISAAEKYALYIGRAFQVVDDILDAVGDEKILGKPIGSDVESGKTTFLTYLSVEKAKSYAKELTEKAKEAISSFNGAQTLCLLADYLLTRQN